MTPLMLLTATLFVLWLTFGVLLPALGRDLSRHMFLRQRGRLYSLGAEHPELRKTLLYRDVEFVITWSCHLVDRNQFFEAFATFGALSGPPTEPKCTARHQRIDRELRDLDPAVVSKMVRILDARAPFLPYLILHNPLILVFTVISTTAILLWQTFRKLTTPGNGNDALRTRVERIERVDARVRQSPAHA